jgi:WD40 repeat protein
VWQIAAHDAQGVLAVDFHPDGSLLTQGKDGQVKLWAPTWASAPATASSSSSDSPTLVINTNSYSFFRCVSLADVCVTACEATAVLAVWDARDGRPLNLIACEQDLPWHGEGEKPKLGMCMSAKLVHVPGSTRLAVVCGFESGHVGVWALDGGAGSGGGGSVVDDAACCDHPHPVKDTETAVEAFARANGVTIEEIDDACDDDGGGGGSSKVGGPLMLSKLHPEPVLCLDVLPDGSEGVSGSAGSLLQRFALNWAKGTLTITKTVTIPNDGVSDVLIRADQRVFASAGWDHRVRLFSWKTSKPLAVLVPHTETIHGLAFAEGPWTKGPPNASSWFASCSKDGTVALFDVY